jgi:hypothetical protein
LEREREEQLKQILIVTVVSYKYLFKRLSFWSLSLQRWGDRKHSLKAFTNSYCSRLCVLIKIEWTILNVHARNVEKWQIILTPSASLPHQMYNKHFNKPFSISCVLTIT